MFLDFLMRMVVLHLVDTEKTIPLKQFTFHLIILNAKYSKSFANLFYMKQDIVLLLVQKNHVVKTIQLHMRYIIRI